MSAISNNVNVSNTVRITSPFPCASADDVRNEYILSSESLFAVKEALKTKNLHLSTREIEQVVITLSTFGFVDCC